MIIHVLFYYILMVRSQSGFALVGFLAAILVLVIFGTVSYVYQNQRNSNSTNSTPAKSISAKCNQKKDIEICLSSSHNRVSSTEEITLTTTIKNHSEKEFTTTFNCTDTDPSLLLNGQNFDEATYCGLAFTSKSIKPIKANGEETFERKISGSKLKEGKNILKAVWAGFESGEIEIKRLAITKDESENQFKTCQSIPDYTDFDKIPGFCASINIVLKNSINGEYPCDKWKSLFENIGLKLPCTIVMDMGVGYIYVPRESAQEWLGKVKELPQVDSAHISRGD